MQAYFNAFLIVFYIIAAVGGSTLIKYGSTVTNKLFVIPVVNMNVSLISLLGITAYGMSFVAYIILLTRFDLSFISPFLIAFVYVLLMLTAYFVFQEQFTLYKIIGCSLILIGILLIVLKR